MNRTDRFDDIVSDWLHADADHRVPEHLDAVLRRTSTERQRPAWSSLERWLPVDTATRFQTRLTPSRPLLAVVVLVALLLAATGVAVYTGALRSQAPAFGLADNGRILVADGSEIRTYAADGTDPRLVVGLPNDAHDVVISPDGKRVAMIVQTSPPTMQILSLDGAKTVTLPTLPGAIDLGTAVSWSPDGTRVTYVAFDGVREHLVVADTDGSRTRELVVDGTNASGGFWSPVWSPDGSTIAFINSDGAANESGPIHLVRPDGSDPQALDIPDVAGSAGIRWAPDEAVQRLLLTRPGNVVSLYDVAAKKETVIGPGFWPTWSPDGSRISYWDDGTVIVSTDDVLAGKARSIPAYPSFSTGTCQDHPELANKAFCGPASWSPDGTRVIAPDITGNSVVSFLADGNGSPIVIPLTTNVLDTGMPAVWQPLRD